MLTKNCRVQGEDRMMPYCSKNLISGSLWTACGRSKFIKWFSFLNKCLFFFSCFFLFSFFFFQEIHQTFKYVSSLMVRENADSFPESYWSTCIVLPPSITVFTQFCCPDIITLLPRNLSNILAVCWLSGVDTILSKRLHIHQLVIQLFHPDSPSTCR